MKKKDQEAIVNILTEMYEDYPGGNDPDSNTLRKRGGIYGTFDNLMNLVYKYGEADIDDKIDLMNQIKRGWNALVKKYSNETEYNEITGEEIPAINTLKKLKQELNDLIKSVRLDTSSQYDMENPYSSDVEGLSKSKLKPDFSDRVSGSDSRGPGRINRNRY